MESVASNSGFFPEKRRRDSIEDIGPSKRAHSWYYVLGSESESDTDQSESVYSVQQKSTDCAKDTSDTSTKSSWSHDELNMVQYEVVSLSEDEKTHPFPINSDSSSAPDDICSTVTFEFTNCNQNGSDTFADSSSESSATNTVDPELSRADFWTCVQCKEQNNNPLFRYCEKCFKVRKNFFPPRPHRKKSYQKQRKRSKKCTDSAGSSGLGTSILENVDLSNSEALASKELKLDYLPNETPVPEKEVALCETCFINPKDGGYVHGNIVHVYNCYKCAIKILKQRGKCPICNRLVRQVLKVIVY